MSQAILILSASGTAQELRTRVDMCREWEFRGFLDDGASGPEILGRIDEEGRFPDAQLLSALGSYTGMARRANILTSIPANRFAHFVDPLALVYSRANLAHGVVIFPFAVLSIEAQIAPHVLVYHHAVVSHDCIVGTGAIISNSATLSGQVQVGEHSYVGAGATILENIKVGSRSIVAAGATVNVDVPDDCIYINSHRIEPNRHYLP